MSFKNPSSYKDLAIHLGVIVLSLIILILFVFNWYLPSTTNHGETITVPEVIGKNHRELERFLGKRSLRYEVTVDSSYSPKYPPLTVLRQVPKPNTKVKENRKIYVTLNAERPPLIRMPKVEDLSLRSAQMVLKSYDLNLGEVIFVPDVFFGVVHEAQSSGRTVLEGEKVEKGTVIDLIVGDGYGNMKFKAPDLIGQEQDEAEIVIIGSGLKIGKVTITKSSQSSILMEDQDGSNYRKVLDISPGGIQEQDPKPGTELKIGDEIDLWVYKPDSISESTTILDNE